MEYTNGEGATKAEKCITFGAVFGFKFLDQCRILWIIFGVIVGVVCIGWFIKYRIDRKTETVQSIELIKLPEGGTESSANPPEGTGKKREETTSLLAFVF